MNGVQRSAESVHVATIVAEQQAVHHLEVASRPAVVRVAACTADKYWSIKLHPNPANQR